MTRLGLFFILVRSSQSSRPLHITTDGGIKNLLQNLHSAFYSEDPRLCEILNNHFKHYFKKEKTKHYPDIDPNLWGKDEIILM